MTVKQVVKAKAAAAGQRQPERVTVSRQPSGMWLVTVDGAGLVVLPTADAMPVMLGKLGADELIALYAQPDPAHVAGM